LVENQFQIPREFKALKGKRIPCFLQGFFQLIFDCNSGELLPDPAIWAIKAVRQICFWVYKLELPYSTKDTVKVLNSFISTELELGQSELESAIDQSVDVRIASEMTGGTIYNGTPVNIFGNFDPEDINPRHGPGAVATGEKGEEKWTFKRLYLPIHTTYSYLRYTMPQGMHELSDPEASLAHLSVLQEGTAKVCLVPKDSRGPRLISSEPLEYMWFQQGLGAGIVSHLERVYPTRGQVNFTSQSINRYLALIGSTQKEVHSSLGHSEIADIKRQRLPLPRIGDGQFVTLDLKDASDRVALALVKRIFSKTPSLLKALCALRTTSTSLPDGRVVSMKKYAPMGSALCFPVEAYCFWILIVAALSNNSARPLSAIMKEVFVYGDDIIVKKVLFSSCDQSSGVRRLKSQRLQELSTG
jgi:hypothetical protein